MTFRPSDGRAKLGERVYEAVRMRTQEAEFTRGGACHCAWQRNGIILAGGNDGLHDRSVWHRN